MSRVATLDERMMGPEPVFRDPIRDNEKNVVLGRALTWYNYFYDSKKCIPWVHEYMKRNGYTKDDIKYIKRLKDHVVGSTLSSLCKIVLNNGDVLPKSSKQWMADRLYHCIELGKKEKEEEVVEEAPKVVVSIQDRMNALAGRLLEDIEGEVDEFIVKVKSDFSLYKFLQSKECSAQVARKIADYYRPTFEEVTDALNKVDPQLVEGYSHLTTAELKRTVAFYQTLVEDADRFAGNKKTIRKPRKKKEKSAAQLSSKVKYLKEFAELKLVSIDPANIVGSNQLWLYNTKYRVLSMYVSSSTAGLSLKGTTIQGFDEKASIKKKLRKPEQTLKQVLDGGKIVLRKLMDGLTTASSECNGRINEETILLRAIK